MDAIFKKLNFKDHQCVHVLNAPSSFDVNLQSIEEETEIVRKVDSKDKIEFALAFGTTQKEVDCHVNLIAPKLEVDAVFWYCYPKGSSKNYTCDFNRDSGWKIMGEYDLEGVRQVAIDEDWSALRFRKIQHIKKFTRNEKMALSREGKRRSKENKR